jgi:SAM-dependent methyltransferase
MDDATSLPEHVARNRAYWDQQADDYVASGERNWAASEPSWGIWSIPESQVHLLPERLGGRDAIELGCGTGYVSAWLARRGARVVGIDNSPKQLDTARRLQDRHDLAFPLLLGNAESVPYPDASFDFAISEYGAAIWCDPYRWIPEAARILRPGGRLSFLGNSVLLMLTTPVDDEDAPASEQLQRPLFGMNRFAWEDGAVEFHLPHGKLIGLLRDSGFEIEDLIEVEIAENATTRYPFVSPEWARRWPAEEVWKVRKR